MTNPLFSDTALADSEPVNAACNRLADALDTLEHRILSLREMQTQSQQVAEESRELLSRHDTLRQNMGLLGEENKKLKHGLQDAELERISQRQQAADVLTHLESAISRLEQTLYAA
jgi:hypothetical protein